MNEKAKIVKTSKTTSNLLRTFPSPKDVFIYGGLYLTLFLLVFWNSFLAYTAIQRLQSRDFSRFFYATLAFWEGNDMYGPTVATLCRWSELFSEHLWDLNPPHFHVFIMPLIEFSLRDAFLVWGIINCLALFISLHLIAKIIAPDLTVMQGLLALIGLLAFSGTGTLLLSGQLSFLILLPLTLAWYCARKTQWIKTGLLLGCVSSLKPFLLIFFPYLVFRKHLRAASSFVLSFFFFFTIGLLVFGLKAHLSWVQALYSVSWEWPAANVSILGALTRLFSENPIFMPILDAPHLAGPIWIIGSLLVGSVTLRIISLDSSQHSIDRAFALLPLSALLISPLGWVLYLFFSIGPLLSLCKDKKWLSSSNRTGIRFLRNCLLLSSLPGLIVPSFLLIIFQPNPLATVFIGSLYFWCTLALWMSIVVDYSFCYEQDCRSIFQPFRVSNLFSKFPQPSPGN